MLGGQVTQSPSVAVWARGEAVIAQYRNRRRFSEQRLGRVKTRLDGSGEIGGAAMAPAGFRRSKASRGRS